MKNLHKKKLRNESISHLDKFPIAHKSQRHLISSYEINSYLNLFFKSLVD